MSAVVFGFVEVDFGKQPVVLAGFNRKNEVVLSISRFQGNNLRSRCFPAPKAGYLEV
ncbi:hypothetical protein DGWBC_1262 [Dehalogenimonas sp. WBC-2]|nr:hypothetical protein DGWBC_1262 [Dehalogenimonas sp. WBC-2]